MKNLWKWWSVTGILLLTGLMFALGISSAAASEGSKYPPEGSSVISVFGEVPGRDMFVHLWAVVPPGENRSEVAREALRRQGARPLSSDNFSWTGLVWDQFFDRNTGNDAVTQYYNPQGDPTNEGRAALQRTQATWGQVAGSLFAFEDGGITDRCPSLVLECNGPQTFDGKNDVGWVDIGGCCTLGVTWYSTTTDEADVALNSKFAWSVDGVNGYDLETVYLHENGHVAGLGHSDEAGSVMLAYYHGVSRTLHFDDEEGLRSLYPSGLANEPPEVSISSPTNGSHFLSGVTIEFAGTASDPEDGELTASISWGSDLDGPLGIGGAIYYVLSDGDHTITASVTDSGGETAHRSINVSVGSATPPDLHVTVESVSYSTKGGKNGDKHLLVTVSIVDETGAAVSGADVSITVENTTLGSSWDRSGTSGQDGSMALSVNNAPAGYYVTTVTGVLVSGFEWDGVTPDNQTVK